MNKDRHLRDNSGFTLLELIIVLSISAIMVLFVGLTLGMINGANVNKAAKNCDEALVQGRVQTMAKGPSTNKVYIWDEDGDTYIKVGDNGEKEMLSNEKIESYFVKYNPTSGLASMARVNNTSTSEGTAQCFVFNNVGALNKTDSTIFTINQHNGVMFKKGNRQTVVYILPETGKIGVVTL